ncbi:MAG: ABC transporter permease, partial [Oscillospiraceae bacterium]|nr:ABC transporter permease [Oscillospiraceae bacterium]
LLFLGDLMRKSLPDMPGVGYLMDSWIMAGTLAVATLTTTMGALGFYVDDRVKGIDRDFAVSPLRRRSLAGGYWLGSNAIALLLCFAALVLAEAYIVINGGRLMGGSGLLKLLGALLLGILSSGCMAFALVSFFRSQNAFTSASVAIGSMTGFLTGIYLPIGQLPGPIQWVVRLFPVSHGGALLRQIMMEEAMAETFRGAPAETVMEFVEEMGIQYRFGSYLMPAWGNILVLACTAIVFFLIGFLNLTRKRKE